MIRLVLSAAPSFFDPIVFLVMIDLIRKAKNDEASAYPITRQHV